MNEIRADLGIEQENQSRKQPRSKLKSSSSTNKKNTTPVVDKNIAEKAESANMMINTCSDNNSSKKLKNEKDGLNQFTTDTWVSD